jgi:hypothetical protein
MNSEPAFGGSHMSGICLHGLSDKSLNSSRLFLWRVMVVTVPCLISGAANKAEVPLDFFIPVRDLAIPPFPYQAQPPLGSGS